MKKRKTQRGFTLIELVMVITIMGIVAAILGPFLAQPFRAYQALSRRTELVSKLNSTMDQMIKDINLAVPNSVREDGANGVGGTTLEMMNVQAFGRYRYSDDENDATALTPAKSDDSFNVLGVITANLAGSRIIINNVDSTDLYNFAVAAPNTNGVITTVTARTRVAAGTVNPNAAGTETNITLPAFNFDLLGTGSPSKRVYFSDTAVRYVCDLNGGTINRISTYQPRQNIGDALPANTTALVVDNVSACSFAYDPGAAQRSGIVTIDIQLTNQGESVRLIQQVQVPNAP